MKTDVGEDWAFATKLTDLSENFEDEHDNRFPELEIFQVKFLGCSKIHAAKSEEATANAIKNIITTAKGEWPFECDKSIMFTFEKKNIYFLFLFFSIK